MPGVVGTQVGYEGGSLEDPTYEDVCSNKTGHAEVVQIEYNPQEVSYGKLLDIFWDNHNPTTLNSQGADRGTQYRSVIFYHNEEQKKEALDSKKKLEESGRYKNPIVTQIIPAETFYRAEEYHQQFYERKGIRI